MDRIGLRAGAVVATAVCALAAPAGAFASVSKARTREVARAESFARAEVAYYERRLPAQMQANADVNSSSVDTSCFSASDNHIDPDAVAGVPTNPAWFERDALNLYCSTLRLRDQFLSPAFAYGTATQGSELYLDQLGQQVTDLVPGHIHGGLTTLVPGALAADPLRTIENYQSLTHATVDPVHFISLDGAQLRGNIFLPPAGTPTLPDGKYPGVVIVDGSVQAYQQLYYWAAEGLAQYGYEVMTFDPQGQGDSDLLPSKCPDLSDLSTLCTGVPYQQNYNFYQGGEDALNFFLSTPSSPYGGSYNPAYSTLDGDDVGIAGHSLGAAAVSWVGQCDSRVKTIVAWDDLDPVTMSQCASNVTVPKADQATALHAPALAMTNDYEFNPQPQTGVPNPNGGDNGGGGDGDKGYLSLVKAGIDSQIVSIRNGTHLTYSYIPAVLPANEIGERVAFYYTLAWLDEYLRGGQDPLLPASDTAFSRLTSLGTFDQSADENDNTVDPGAADISFGTGTYDASKALADPSNPYAGNEPYEIQGISIPDTLSFYYYSEYALHDPATGRLKTCNDMLAGCPAVQPPTP